MGRKHEVIDEEEVANGLESGDRSYDVEACGWKRKIIAHGLARINTDWRLRCPALPIKSGADFLEGERGSR